MNAARLALAMLAIVACTMGNNWPPPLPGEVGGVENPTAVALVCPEDDGNSAAFPPGLPRGETVSAGAITGSFAVSASGDATYTIPLVVPPGRLGMEPQLSITYSSSSGEGLLGAGFHLAGLSAITRCPANLAQDGYVRPVRNDAGDHYCLDGARLVLITKTSAFDGTSTREYRTFPDSFAKIVGHYPAGADLARGPESFEVFTRSGRIIEYGSTANSQAMAGDQRIAAWWISKERDRRDNAVTYTYHNELSPEDGHTLEINPASISYAHDAGAQPTRVVRFARTGRATPLATYHAGLLQRRSFLLARVDMMIEPGHQVVRSYRLHHEESESTKRPLLQSIEECVGDDGPCKPATRFDWSSQLRQAPTRHDTPTMIPDTSFGHKERFVWLMADVNGDGLEDLVISHPSVDDSDFNEWWVGLNHGGGFDAPKLWDSFKYPAHPGRWNAYPIDYDQDGLTDILIDAQDTDWASYRVLRATPQRTFELFNTGVPRPASIAPVTFDFEFSQYRFMRLGDVNGDGVADLIECVNPFYEIEDLSYTRRWTVRLWSPSLPGGKPGFEAEARAIPFLDHVVDCAAGERSVYVADTDGDGRSELVVPFVGGTWGTVRHVAGDDWESLPLDLFHDRSRPFTRLHFLDANADGLSDVIMTGLGHGGCYGAGGGYLGEVCGVPTNDGPMSIDLPFRFTNNGATFEPLEPTLAGPLVPGDWTDFYAAAAAPVDWNGDGRMDLLLPMMDRCAGPSDEPCWVVLQSSLSGAAAMTPFETHLPARTDASGFVIAPQYELRVTDVDGDGRHDLIGLAEDGQHFAFYKSQGPQDLLVAVTDGMNPLDPGEPGFVPTVSISYDSLVDRAVTDRVDPASLAHDELTYVARSDPDNDCAYPRACVVGSERVVKSYAVNDGQNQPRRFDVRYRDARYHRRGRGFLGFGERVVIDADTAAGVIERYDNITHDPDFDSYPHAGQVVWSASWTNEKPLVLDPGRVEISLVERGFVREPTYSNGTYFTLPSITRATRTSGTMTPAPGQSVLRFVREAPKLPLSLLGRTLDKAVVHDTFGNVLLETHEVDGADVSATVVRGYENDPATWLIGKLTFEEECSTAAQVAASRCRRSSLGYNGFGEVVSVSVGDAADPGTELSTRFSHDARGHVTRTVAEDAFGHRRRACVSYDAEGVFPFAARNALQHTSFARFDRGLGVLTAALDVNGLATRWAHDGFGRVTKEVRADGTSSRFALSRAKDGGPTGNWWSVKAVSRGDGAPITTVTLDGLGRAVHSLSVVAEVEACGASGCQPTLVLEQETRYDHLGRVIRETLPWMRGDLLAGALHHDYEHDASGRVTMHVEPWGRVTTFEHAGSATSATDWLGTSTVHTDALGRTVKAVDNMGHATETRYGPFGSPWSVVRLSTEVTLTERDAYGRVVREIDPDRGLTETTYNGFGEVLTIDDENGRHYDFSHDDIGRRVKRSDPDGVTRWEYDTAPNGVGKLARVENPVSEKRYTYDALARPASVALTLDGDTLQATFGYDKLGRLGLIAYPQIPGVDPLVVRREYDEYGNLVRVQDNAGGEPYWRLDGLDGAGRAAVETFANGTVTRREVSPRTGLTRRLRTTLGGTAIQDLAYEHDQARRLVARTDNLQVGAYGVRAELFDHDPQGRLTCARFATVPPGFGPPKVRVGPCEQTIEYAPNGNILHKSDVGDYTYAFDHPHAVLTAGAGSYAHDAVGNQVERPGASIEYTAFDLPSVVTTAEGGSVGFSYDGDQQRIRKRSAAEDTAYFEDLYERVSAGGLPTVHRYYVAAGSATLVLARRAGQPQEMAYLHGDALGSTDVVSGAAGAVIERRSFDPFGARRNPAWGEPFSGGAKSKVSPLGFTGHESDEDLGLVNMRGRIYDPRLGRFLMTDPIVSSPHLAQSWNPYSYVRNRPLDLVDPTGFEEQPRGCEADGKCYRELVRVIRSPGTGPKPDELVIRSPVKDASRDDAQSRAPVDKVEAPVSTRPWREHAAARLAREAARGVAGGLIPLGPAVDQTATRSGALAKGTAGEQVARAVGQAVGGTVLQLIGFGIAAHGGGVQALSGGSGAAVAVPEVALGMTIAVAGAVTVSQAWHVLLSTGSGGGPVKITISKSKHKETAAHIEEAQKSGKPTTLTIDRAGAAARRRESMRGTERVPGMDRDEYPPAMFKEGGQGASVKPVTPGDNRGAGACMGAQCSDLPDGTVVEITVGE